MVVTLEIEDNWYWFLVFGGGIAIMSGIVLFFESRSKDDAILKIKPQIVLRNLLLNQIGFYLNYLLVTFSLDITIQEPFWIHQVFTSVEFSFNTYRGLFTCLALILAMGCNSIVLAAVIRTYKNMLDYCFSLFVIHFIIVSIVQGDFPTSGSWWAASAIGLFVSMIASERISYQLETMSYQSHLNGPDYKSRRRSRSDLVDLPEINPEDNNLYTPRKTEYRFSLEKSESKSTEKSDTSNEKAVARSSSKELVSKVKTTNKEEKISEKPKQNQMRNSNSSKSSSSTTSGSSSDEK